MIFSNNRLAKKRDECITLQNLLDKLKSENGSFTVEATLIFPIILLIIIILLLFALYMYQKSVLYYTASVAAERTSFNWDNSKRGVDGIPKSGADDGLYWRMSGNGMLQTLLGLTGSSNPYRFQLPVIKETPEEGGSSGEPLVVSKIKRSANWIPAELQGEIQYRQALVGTLEVNLLQPLTIEPLEKTLGHSTPTSSAAVTIVDPVEFIRTVDLVRYYSAKFISGSSDKEQAGAVLTKFTSSKEGTKR